MSELILNEIAKKFNLSHFLVKSWIENKSLLEEKEAHIFFENNSKMIKATPFVKWVWWKRQLIKQLENLFPKDFNNYHEPFLWWGAVFFNLHKKQSFLSDINSELINTYQIVKKHPKDLISLLETFEYSKDFYTEIRSWDRGENWLNDYNEIQRAARFIYLNRTCFNWLYRVNSRWEFNVPMWKYVNPDFVQKENILNVSKLLNETKATIKLQSFEKVLDKAKTGDFVYFDPPYDTLTNTANFTSYNESWFGRNMQEKLRDVFVELDKRWCKVMLSNHNTPFIREIFDWFRFEIVKARRNVNSNWAWRGEVEEIVVMNY